jgi:hypothetical protein
MVAKIRGRLPESLEIDVTKMKEYPKAMNQSSVERRKEMLRPTQLGKAREATID